MFGYHTFPIYTQVAPEPLTICRPLEGSVFSYPFFNDGISFAAQKNSERTNYPGASMPETTGDDLLTLRGFIFHTSHCGSTLLSGMLSGAGVRVVKETEAINGLLLSYLLYNLPEEKVLSHLKKIMEAYKQPFPGEQYVLFKLTSWNIFCFPLFEKLYPETPWLYLDRDIDAVVQSLLKSDGGFAAWWGHPADSVRRLFLPGDIHVTEKESYLRQMVLQHGLYARQYQNDRSLFLQYPDFLNGFEAKILPHFNLHFSKEALAEAENKRRFEAKKPGVLRSL
jgi:hypothetical protein